MSESSPKTLRFENFKETINISTEHGDWFFNVYKLALVNGVNTILSKDRDFEKNSLSVSWHDLLNHPEEARIYISPYFKQEESFDWRFQRSKELADSLKTYDDLMINSKLTYTKEDIIDMLKIPQLPRPNIVLVHSDRRGLKEFFKRQDFPQDDHRAYRVPWNKLVELAEVGHLPLF